MTVLSRQSKARDPILVLADAFKVDAQIVGNLSLSGFQTFAQLRNLFVVDPHKMTRPKKVRYVSRVNGCHCYGECTSCKLRADDVLPM